MNDRPTQDILEAPGSEATAAPPDVLAYAPAARRRTELAATSAPATSAVNRQRRGNDGHGNDGHGNEHLRNEHRVTTAAVTSTAVTSGRGTRAQRAVAGRRARRPDRAGGRFAHTPGLLLVAILTVQAVLSLRLVWANTAFLDEATYLFAGHAELAHWLHGAPPPSFATYFSGAPVIYPPLARWPRASAA